MPGAAVSICTATPADGMLVLPAASCACAVKVKTPSGLAGVVTLQLPAPSAVVVVIASPPRRMVMVAPASAVPARVSVVSFVAPDTTPASSLMEVMMGAAGAALSTVTARAADAGPVPPAASVATAVKLCAPSVRAAVVKLHVPAPVTVAVPSDVAPSKISISAPASAVPVSTSVVSRVMPSPAAPVSSE